MASGGTDSFERWALPEDGGPPLIGELLERIDAAHAAARAAESAAVTIGAVALEEAEEARRLAGLAAQGAAGGSQGRAGSPGGRPRGGTVLADSSPDTAPRDPLQGFTARADRVSERLRRLQGLQLSA